MPEVILANKTKFECQSDQVILEGARQQGIALEHSCRTGQCGVCKAFVLKGDSVVQQSEIALSKEEKASGYILTCCRKASSQLQLDIEDLGELGGIQVKTLPCRIDQLELLTDDVMEVTLRTPPASKLEYVPGQYVDMIGKNGIRRSYSIANAPREDGKLTLQIRKVPDGEMSRYWFHEAKVDDLLRMEGPFGTFSLRNTDATQLILLATGTGIAPIRALLQQLSTSDKFRFSQINLVWGGRVEQDIYWHADFPSLPLKFTPVLSRSEARSGRKGYVQNVVIEDGLPLENSIVYACGSEAMINSAHMELVEAGLNRKNFHSDAFVSSN